MKPKDWTETKRQWTRAMAMGKEGRNLPLINIFSFPVIKFKTLICVEKS